MTTFGGGKRPPPAWSFVGSARQSVAMATAPRRAGWINGWAAAPPRAGTAAPERAVKDNGGGKISRLHYYPNSAARRGGSVYQPSALVPIISRRKTTTPITARPAPKHARPRSPASSSGSTRRQRPDKAHNLQNAYGYYIDGMGRRDRPLHVRRRAEIGGVGIYDGPRTSAARSDAMVRPVSRGSSAFGRRSTMIEILGGWGPGPRPGTGHARRFQRRQERVAQVPDRFVAHGGGRSARCACSPLRTDYYQGWARTTPPPQTPEMGPTGDSRRGRARDKVPAPPNPVTAPATIPTA
jgi:hypothetical protein